MTLEGNHIYNKTVDMMHYLTDQQLSAVYTIVVGMVENESTWESPLGIETEEQMWAHIDHSLDQIKEGRVAPAKQASSRLRAEYNL